MARTPDEIDRMLAAPKRLFRAPEWIEDDARATLTSPIVSPGGLVIGGLSLRLVALTHLPAPGRGSPVLVLDEAVVQRLSFRPDHAHINPARDPVPAELRRLKLSAGRSRFYRWPDNRQWPRPDKAVAGTYLDPEPSTIEDAFALFLDNCGIADRPPPPPHRPMLEF